MLADMRLLRGCERLRDSASLRVRAIEPQFDSLPPRLTRYAVWATLVQTPETLSWLKYGSELVRDAFAAGFGAWIGAWYAFRLERQKKTAERTDALQTAGNYAVFTLTRILNSLLIYKRMYDEAAKTRSPWFQLPATRVADRDFVSFDLPSLAFLFESKEKDGPLMPMKLAIEQERYAAFLEQVRLRGELHQEILVYVTERDPDFASKVYTDDELQRKVGPTPFYKLRNYYTDITGYLERDLKTSEALLKELRALLEREFRGRRIVGFERAPLEGPEPIMAARARNPIPRPPENL
jgi:hypothetical protein